MSGPFKLHSEKSPDAVLRARVDGQGRSAAAAGARLRRSACSTYSGRSPGQAGRRLARPLRSRARRGALGTRPGSTPVRLVQAGRNTRHSSTGLFTRVMYVYAPAWRHVSPRRNGPGGKFRFKGSETSEPIRNLQHCESSQSCMMSFSLASSSLSTAPSCSLAAASTCRTRLKHARTRTYAHARRRPACAQARAHAQREG